MENKDTMNLQQKLIAISNEMPKLLKKHYSDEVDYDFVKIDDIFELLNPAFTKYHICLQELEETDATYSKVDGSWIYTAKLTFFIVNADCLDEKERVSIQLVGDHLDSPAKAKGAAWTYGFKYFFLYKFRMKQETEDPDMKGTPPNGPDKSKGNAEQKKIEVPVKPQKSAKESSDVIADSPLSQPPVTDMNQKKENIKQVDFLPDPADFLKENEAEDTGEDAECHEVEREEQQSLEVTETSGSLNTEEETKNLGDMSTEFLESDDEGTSEHPPTKDLKTDKAVQEPEKKENVSGEKINEEKKEETKGKQKEETKDSPIMKQWKELKAKHPDALLLFRVGDFYEMYEQDAKRGAEVLGITLTKRNTQAGPYMAGFPHHALDTYLPKLIRAGERVAICDQLEAPKQKQEEQNTEEQQRSGGMKR